MAICCVDVHTLLYCAFGDILVPLMTMRLTDLDSKAVASWLHAKTQVAPTTAAQAFRALCDFLT